MRRHHLPVISAGGNLSPQRSALRDLSPRRFALRDQDLQAPDLGVLSVHLQGRPCQVKCPYCYLGRREDSLDPGREARSAAVIGREARSAAVIDAVPAPDLLRDLLSGLRYSEVAVALSEPIGPVLPALREVALLVTARQRLLTLTTTSAAARELPADILAAAGRISLSIDPSKGPVTAAEVARITADLRQRSPAQRVLIVTLTTPRFARALLAGLLAQLLDLPDVDRISLSALKPPPPWCDQRFWLRTLSRLGPLLRTHLDRRLFLDCYVAARILGTGGCPARPDLSPAAGGLAFRSCVYQPRADLFVHDAATLSAHLQGFTPPAVCPFPIR